jgi:hypothetical protein
MRPQLLSLILAGCLASACVPNKIYRSAAPGTGPRDQQYFVYEELQARQFEPAETNDTSSYPYRLGFVEFDDRGEMFKRDQLRAVVAEIAKAKQEAAAEKERVVVAMFVHGWKNNAASGNVWGFRQVLAGLSKTFGKRRVVGVYIGWRGAVLSPPLLKEFTFFDRQQKSQNLTGGHVVEALLKILQAAKGADYQEDTSSAATVLIGHSFGGAVLETGLTQTLVGLAVRAKATNTAMRWPADLTILVNEAQEASRSYQLVEALKENLPERDAPKPEEKEKVARPDQCLPSANAAKRLLDPPAIVSISSTGDTATRLAYKAVQAIQRPFNSLRTYDEDDPNMLGLKRQTPMFLNTTAHMKEFQSHVMGRCRCNTTDCDPTQLTCEDPAVEAAKNACGVVMMPALGPTPGRYVISEKPKTMNRTAYWVLQMPPAAVPDHSTIFTPTFRDLVVSLFCRTMSPTVDGVPAMCQGG